MQVPTIIEKLKSTVKERYGIDNVMQCAKFKEKQHDTMLEKYGVTSPIQVPHIKQKIHLAMLKNNDMGLYHTRDTWIKKAITTHGHNYNYDHVVYKKSHEKINIQCLKCDHIFNQRPYSHVQGKGCPLCKYKNESKCREYLEETFHCKFRKCNPTWLHGLQLDGYNEKLQLAFEYQGQQHYDPNTYFNTLYCDNGLKYKKQVQRDQTKRSKCIINNVTLIEIPYFVPNIDDYLYEQLVVHGYLANVIFID